MNALIVTAFADDDNHNDAKDNDGDKYDACFYF